MNTFDAVRIQMAFREGRDLNRERWADMATVARVLQGLDAEGKAAAAYDHVSHGCPFEETAVVCPVGCESPDNIANETLAFFGGISHAR